MVAENEIYWREAIGAWWPRYDHKPEKCFEFVQHGLGALTLAHHYLRNARSCVQAGGHAGYWPRHLAEMFSTVYTFEPEPALFECLLRNCMSDRNIVASGKGLGASAGRARFKSHVSAGSWRVDEAGEHEIELTTVDLLNLEDCDGLFLDVEGYEVEALKGAAATIKRCQPLILVELLPRSAAAIQSHLARLLYKQVARFGRDGIYLPR